MAQGHFGCGTTQMYNELIAKYPEAAIQQQKYDSVTRLGAGSNRGPNDVYVIPIVFHIIHNYGSENISDDQIYDAVRIINEDFRKLNADTTAIVNAFKPIAADAMIEFRLAGRDPQGNCTNGINRIHSLQTYNGDDNAKLNPWPRNYYLNIWVVSSMRDGVAGYAYYPGAVEGLRANIDGVMILHNYVGSIGTSNVTNSRALTHEIGHSLNLPHTWGNTNQPGVACGDDGIQDTPPTAGWTTCNLNGNRCTAGVLENVQNYMEYAYCSKMFTLGQRDVMRSALENPVSGRSNLWSQSNLVFTGTNLGTPICAPHADFYTTQKMACIGDQINFRDASWGGDNITYNWTFEGGTPATSADQHPVVSFDTPGWHSVTLQILASGGNSTVTKNDMVYVASSSAAYFGGYSENFENSNRFANDYVAFNLDPFSDSKWELANGGFESGSSARLNNFGNVKNDVDELVGPSIDLSMGAGGAQYLYFRYSNATSAQTIAEMKDTLRVLYSVDCGKTWVRLATLTGLDLANDGFHAEPYAPYYSLSWKQYSVSLPTAATVSNNFRFKFQFKSSDKGNNIYLDNINIGSTVGVDEQDLLSSSFSAYPNPANNLLNLSYSITQNDDVKISMFDLLGKEMANVNVGPQVAGMQTQQLNTAGLPSGIYFVKLQVGNHQVTKKVLIAR